MIVSSGESWCPGHSQFFNPKQSVKPRFDRFHFLAADSLLQFFFHFSCSHETLLYWLSPICSYCQLAWAVIFKGFNIICYCQLWMVFLMCQWWSWQIKLHHMPLFMRQMELFCWWLCHAHSKMPNVQGESWLNKKCANLLAIITQHKCSKTSQPGSYDKWGWWLPNLSISLSLICECDCWLLCTFCTLH